MMFRHACKNSKKENRQNGLRRIGCCLLVVTITTGFILDTAGKTSEFQGKGPPAYPVEYSTVYKLFETGRLINEKISIAKIISEHDPQGFLELLDAYSMKKRGSDAVEFILGCSISEDVCHMRHILGYFSLRTNWRLTLRQLTEIAIEKEQELLNRIYAIELIGLSCDESTINCLLGLLYDPDPFIGAEAAMALEKVVISVDKKDRLKAKKAMYDAMLMQEHECAEYPIRRNHIAWAYRDLFGKPKKENLISSLKGKGIKKDSAEKIAEKTLSAIESEERWTFDDSRGLESIYKIWKRKNKGNINPEDYITILTQGVDSKLINTFSERLEIIKKYAPKIYHFIINYSGNIILTTKQKTEGYVARANAQLNVIQISENNLRPIGKEIATLIILLPHETGHLYSYYLGDRHSGYRGEEKSQRAEYCARNLINSEIISRTEFYRLQTGNIKTPLTEEECWKGLIINLLKKEHWK